MNKIVWQAVWSMYQDPVYKEQVRVQIKKNMRNLACLESYKQDLSMWELCGFDVYTVFTNKYPQCGV